MLITDWNERFTNQDFSWNPSPLLVQLTDEVAPGRALDLASGPGRNAIHLAQSGWHVTAVDASSVALDLLRRRAAERGVTVDTRLADLEKHEFTIEPDTYDLICDFFYLQRDLFPQISAGIRPGGVFAGSIHLFEPGREASRYSLNSGELRGYFQEWKILYYSENRNDEEHKRRSAHIIARRA